MKIFSIITLAFAAYLSADDQEIAIALRKIAGTEVELNNRRIIGISSGNKFADAEAILLVDCTELRSISLIDSTLTDAGWANLRNAKKLVSISLDAEYITDKAIATFNEFPELEFVCLSRCKITNKGLNQLGQVPKLKTLSLLGTKIAKIDVERFKLAHPEIGVEWSESQ